MRRTPGLPRRLRTWATYATLAATAAACRPDRTPDLLGTWQATYLIEEGDTVDVRLDDVSLRFDSGGRYVYTSTLDYYEEGAFALTDDILATTPDVDSVGPQRVRVTALDPGALALLMFDDGRQRVLAFERVVPADTTLHSPSPFVDEPDD